MKHAIFLTVALVLIVAFGVLVSFSRPSDQRLVLGQALSPSPTPSERPKPVSTGNIPAPQLSAISALAVDIESGTVLYEKNSNLRLYPASTTKLVTALVAMDYFPLEKVLTFPGTFVEGQKMKLVKGETMTVGNLLYGLLMFSANDAAETLANGFPGGKENFVVAMNLKIKQLGLSDTFFENPTGLDSKNQYTTAHDLVEVAKYAMQRPFIAEIVRTKKIVVESADGKITHNLVNINELLGKVDGILGVKTGWTENAKENLITYLERDGKKIMIVVLGSQDRFGETESLIDWILSSYKWS
jgi:D-alanyl-D-alanine carboxypeptidase (penicillin-binding protein 5/6)